MKLKDKTLKKIGIFLGAILMFYPAYWVMDKNITLSWILILTSIIMSLLVIDLDKQKKVKQ